MNDIALTVGTYAFTYAQVALGFAVAVILLLALLARSTARAAHERSLEAAAAAERAREFDEKVAEMARLQAEMHGRMQTMAEIFGTRQADLARLLSERLDGLQHRVGQGLETTARHTSENIARLNERLAVIDAAQKNLTDLTGEVVGLKEILANKQARGAYGQGRMEAIVRDGLPPGAYTFQATLSNRTRPDCLVHLPGDHPLVIDAKFPLEGFAAFRDARSEEARRQAAQRVRADVTATCATSPKNTSFPARRRTWRCSSSRPRRSMPICTSISRTWCSGPIARAWWLSPRRSWPSPSRSCSRWCATRACARRRRRSRWRYAACSRT
jgi:DNA recombination protein RmuC